jgi:hypothetical protein
MRGIGLKADWVKRIRAGPHLRPRPDQSIFDFSRVLKNKHQAISQGVRRFGKRSLFSDR